MNRLEGQYLVLDKETYTEWYECFELISPPRYFNMFDTAYFMGSEDTFRFDLLSSYMNEISSKLILARKLDLLEMVLDVQNIDPDSMELLTDVLEKARGILNDRPINNT